MKLKIDLLHYALLAVLVLLVFYAASTYGLFKERRELMSGAVRGGIDALWQASARLSRGGSISERFSERW